MRLCYENLSLAGRLGHDAHDDDDDDVRIHESTEDSTTCSMLVPYSSEKLFNTISVFFNL